MKNRVVLHSLLAVFCASTSFNTNAKSEVVYQNKQIEQTSDREFEEWLSQQYKHSWLNLLQNISPEGTKKGVVIASPSKADPDYFYHWVRDAALVMRAVSAERHDESFLTAERAEEKLKDYLSFIRILQPQDAMGGLGEPKYYVDGRPYDGPWGRPQNDGPALRASVFSTWALDLLEQGKADYVKTELYEAQLPGTSPIKTDLEYVSHNWKNPNFDLWEEVFGQHFYTKMVQLRSFRDGAELAQKMGDPGAAAWYLQQAREVKRHIGWHLQEDAGHIVSTLDHYSRRGIDVSNILALNHTYTKGDVLMSYSNEWALATVQQLEEAFNREYTINQRGMPAVAIGRYPEDVYYGGNPWFLATHGIAEFHYRLASELSERGTALDVTTLSEQFWRNLGVDVIAGQRLAVTSDLLSLIRNRGDAYLLRSKMHVGEGHNMAEQYHRDTGFQLAAPDLTWSYASFITAIKARSGL